METVTSHATAKPVTGRKSAKNPAASAQPLRPLASRAPAPEYSLLRQIVVKPDAIDPFTLTPFERLIDKAIKPHLGSVDSDEIAYADVLPHLEKCSFLQANSIRECIYAHRTIMAMESARDEQVMACQRERTDSTTPNHGMNLCGFARSYVEDQMGTVAPRSEDEASELLDYYTKEHYAGFFQNDVDAAVFRNLVLAPWRGQRQVAVDTHTEQAPAEPDGSRQTSTGKQCPELTPSKQIREGQDNEMLRALLVLPEKFPPKKLTKLELMLEATLGDLLGGATEEELTARFAATPALQPMTISDCIYAYDVLGGISAMRAELVETELGRRVASMVILALDYVETRMGTLPFRSEEEASEFVEAYLREYESNMSEDNKRRLLLNLASRGLRADRVGVAQPIIASSSVEPEPSDAMVDLVVTSHTTFEGIEAMAKACRALLISPVGHLVFTMDKMLDEIADRAKDGCANVDDLASSAGVPLHLYHDSRRTEQLLNSPLYAQTQALRSATVAAGSTEA